MKTKDVDDNIIIEDQVTITNEPLVSTEIISSKFSHFSKNIEVVKEYAVSLVIENDEGLTIADNNLKSINESLKNIDKVRKTFKDPYLTACNDIDNYVKENFTIPLEENKSLITKSVTSYKTIQTAQAKLKLEKEQQKVKETLKEKEEEITRLSRIENQLLARIYGGSWMNAKGIKNTSLGCQRYKETEEVLDIIKEKMPPVESFKHLVDEYNSMKKDMLIKLAKHKSNLIELISEDPAIRERATNNIRNSKIAAGIEMNDKKDNISVQVQKEVAKETKAAKKQVAETSKGMRKTLKFEAVDITKVPKEFLMLNESAVREWAKNNKEAISKQMLEGDSIIDGIKYSLEEKYVNR
jgi:hypothetical protein